MKERVAILARKESDAISLLDELKLRGVEERSEIFFTWEDICLSEQKKAYDFILIDYSFFDTLRNDVVVYHLFQKCEFKITFYCNVSRQIKTEKEDMAVDLYRVFFRPFMDFGKLIRSTPFNKDETKTEEHILKSRQETEKGLYVKDAFFLKEGYSLVKFNLNEVLCLESDLNYITIYLSNGKHVIRETLQSVLEILPSNFLKINRSVIINVDKISKLVGNRIHINGLNSFRPVVANKYKLNVLNALPMFSQKQTRYWLANKKNKSA